MKRIHTLLCAAALLSLGMLSGCEKEKDPAVPSNPLRLAVSNYNHDGKAFVNGSTNKFNWTSGDEIRITVGNNNYKARVNITSPNGDQIATPDVYEGGTFSVANGQTVYAAYPLSSFSSATLGTLNYVTYPATYSLEMDGQNQVLKSPMLGCVTRNTDNDYDTLYFKSACALLKVNVMAGAGSLIIDKIKVEAFSDADMTNKVQLSGTKSVTELSLDNNNKVTFSVPNGWENTNLDNNSVLVDLGSNGIAINTTTSHDIYIPIPPVPANTKLKLSFHNMLNDSWIENYNGNLEKPLTITCGGNISNHVIATLPNILINASEEYEIFDWIDNVNNNGVGTNKSFELKDGDGNPVKPDNNSKMEMTFKVLNPGGSQYYSGSAEGTSGTLWFGISGSSNTNVNELLCTHFNGGYSYSSNDNTNGGNRVIKRNNGHKYRVECEVKRDNDSKYYLQSIFEDLDANITLTKETDDAHRSTTGIPSSAPGIRVFQLRSVENGYYCPGMRLYSYKVSKNEVLLFNFVPAIHHVQNENDEIGVYNTVTRSFIKVDEVVDNSNNPHQGTYFKVGND